MDIFDEELLNFWRSLNKHNVRYIMVGGVATNLNGFNRPTDDIDVWVDDTLQNRQSFGKAYKEYSTVNRSKDQLDVIEWRNKKIPGRE